MPIPGGHADKFGNRFEANWGVQVMVHILLGLADSIQIESALEDDKIEFVLVSSGKEGAWQIKRQTSQDTWTLTGLSSRGVLGFLEQAFLQKRSAVFASMSDSPQLRDLVDRADSSATLPEFLEQVKTEKSNKNFEIFKGILKADDKTGFEILQNTQLEYKSERSLVNDLDILLATLCDKPEAARTILFNLYFDSVGKVLNKNDILNCLRSSGISIREDQKHTLCGTITSVTKEYFEY
jgi:hypothetical protein